MVSFRHIYLSRPEIESLDYTQRKHIAQQMGHALNTQISYMYDVQTQSGRTEITTDIPAS